MKKEKMPNEEKICDQEKRIRALEDKVLDIETTLKRNP